MQESAVTHVPGLSCLPCEDVGHSWGYGNKITLFSTSFQSNIEGDSCSKVHSKLFDISWERTLYNPIVRKLVNESCSTFTSVQAKSKLDTQEKHAELLKLSHQYRCIMSACIDDLNNAVDNTSDQKQADELDKMSEIFYKAELIWSLCEIVFLEKPTCIVHNLVEWIRLHFPTALEETTTLFSSPEPASHENYWKIVYGLVFQLQFEHVVRLLKLHPSFNSDSFQSVVELLKKMPVIGASSVHSIPEFNFRWSHWKEECESRLMTGEFMNYKQLELIVKILCGQEDAFESLKSMFETWYQRLFTQLIFQQPTITGSILAEEAENFLTSLNPHKLYSPLDATIIAALKRDTHKVIGEMQSVLDNSWFAAHLSDLLFHAGVLHSFEEVNSAQLREAFLCDYAVCLFSHQSLWSAGVAYLDSCPTYGMAMLEELLNRMPCTSDFKARKLIFVAEQRNLVSVVNTVCRVMGRRALAQERLGSAVAWAVRAQDSFLATHAADQVLKNYLRDSSFTSADLLDSLGAGLLASDRLAFLGKYREFHRLYQKNDFQSASALLVSLISSRIAPKYFWTVLLMDALPLLETNPPVINTEQTYELMQSLQELTSSYPESEESTEEASTNMTQDKSMLITLALSRNLAKCFVQSAMNSAN